MFEFSLRLPGKHRYIKMLTSEPFFVFKIYLDWCSMNKVPDTILAHHKDITSAVIVYAAVG